MLCFRIAAGTARKCTDTAMTARSHELDRAVLEAVSEEYQSFEAVVSKLSLANLAYAGVSEVERILLSSISDNLVAAYLLHADPPYATKVGANSDNIRRYWFCITEQGRKYLGVLTRKQTVSHRNLLL
jgi:hypothetical protein